MAAEPVRFGILSTARIGRKIVRALAGSAKAELVAVGSRDVDKADAYCREQELGDEVTRHASYEALLADERVEAIYNPLPNALHAEWTIKAAEAGKHILSEKPMASDVGECLEMIRRADRAGVVLMEAFMYRHHPATWKLKDVVTQGKIGDVRLINSGFSFMLTDETNVRYLPGMAGGATMDVGCYCINFSRLIAGEEPSRAYAVGTFSDDHPVDESLYGTLEFPSGIVSQFDCSIRSWRRSYVSVVGTTGTIHADRPWIPDPIAQHFLLNEERVTVKNGGDPYQREVEVLVAAIRDGESLPIPPIDGARNMAVVEAVLKSARTGVAQEVEPVVEPVNS